MGCPACREAQRLRDRVEQLEDLLGVNDAPPTVRPRRVGVILGLFARREMVSRSTVRVALDNEDMGDRQVDVYVSSARKWLRGHGFTLQVEYGQGLVSAGARTGGAGRAPGAAARGHAMIDHPVITVDMVAAAAARAASQGEDLKRRTPHYVAQYLVVWDVECRGLDYTGAVSAAQRWLKGFA